MIYISCNTDQTFKASCSWELGLCDRRWGCDKNSNVLENNLTQSIRIMGQNDGSPLHPTSPALAFVRAFYSVVVEKCFTSFQRVVGILNLYFLCKQKKRLSTHCCVVQSLKILHDKQACTMWSRRNHIGQVQMLNKSMWVIHLFLVALSAF
jgi:hypothetical protein